MTKKQKVFFISILIAELVAITAIGHTIFEKRRSLPENASVTTLKKNSLIFATNTVLQHFYEPDSNAPHGMIWETPTWLTGTVTNTINADTLNERFEYPIEKPNDTYRIITLGDSFTFGLFVDTEKNYSEKLEDALNAKIRCGNIQKFEVINLGVPGYDIDYARERYSRRGKKYEADMVIWLIQHGNFVKPQEEVLARAGLYQNEPESADKARQSILRDRGEDALIAYEAEALRAIELDERQVLVLAGMENGLWGKPLELAKAFARERKNAYVHILRPESFEPGKELFPDHHPNEEGHALIARDLFTFLANGNMILCN